MLNESWRNDLCSMVQLVLDTIALQACHGSKGNTAVACIQTLVNQFLIN